MIIFLQIDSKRDPPSSVIRYLLWRNNTGNTITIASVKGVLYSGTNVIGQAAICAGADLVTFDITDCTNVDTSNITFTPAAGEVSDDGNLGGDVTLADGEWIAWETTSVSSPGALSVCISE